MRKFIAILALLSPLFCWADSLSGRIVGVSDGDTVTLLTEQKQQVKIRMNQIDAPEKSQAFGMKSKQALSDLCFNKPAIVESSGNDKYGRTIGALFCDGVDANEEQIKAGMAWVYRQYSHDAHLIELEDEAKVNSTGLWSDASPVPPWEFRHGVKQSKQKVTQADDASEGGFSCAGKHLCREMDSCEEAKFYLHKCGVSRLDRDHDGVPCESICGSN